MDKELLSVIAQKLIVWGKGILAADESTDTITKRLAKIKVESTPDNRRAYRELLFTTPGIEEYISGVILFDETIRQSTGDGLLFTQLFKQKGIITGIKVDKGTVPLPGTFDELLTEGLEGLAERLAEYKKLGADFAKWRAVITIGNGIPSLECITQNAIRLAEYARLCQEADIVPIVEPEVLMAGAHTIERCYEVTTQVLQTVFVKLNEAGVYLPGILLKPNMVVAGSEAQKSSVEEIARLTGQCLRESVPADVPGIVFLSGGQSELEATVNLQAIEEAKGDAPWNLTFSYGRALQDSALKAWKGDFVNVPTAQAIFLNRAKMDGLAAVGKYRGE